MAPLPTRKDPVPLLQWCTSSLNIPKRPLRPASEISNALLSASFISQLREELCLSPSLPNSSGVPISCAFCIFLPLSHGSWELNVGDFAGGPNSSCLRDHSRTGEKCLLADRESVDCSGCLRRGSSQPSIQFAPVLEWSPTKFAGLARNAASNRRLIRTMKANVTPSTISSCR
jgi:hypothetical protein